MKIGLIDVAGMDDSQSYSCHAVLEMAISELKTTSLRINTSVFCNTCKRKRNMKLRETQLKLTSVDNLSTH